MEKLERLDISLKEKPVVEKKKKKRCFRRRCFHCSLTEAKAHNLLWIAYAYDRVQR